MKKILALILLTLASVVAHAETSLFNSAGQATAYIADDATVYMWDGRPAAYLKSDGSYTHVYGFNGKHLGWLVKGVIYDHDGKASGAVKQAFVSSTSFEPFKAFKQFKPFKAFTEFAPYQPYLSNSWSDLPFETLLEGGIE